MERKNYKGELLMRIPSFLLISIMLASAYSSICFSEDEETHKPDICYIVKEEINEIKNTDDLLIAMKVNLKFSKTQERNERIDWYLNQADTKACNLINSFCKSNPDAPKILVDVAKKNPDIMEEFIEKTLWDSYRIPQTPIFDWAFWECVKIIAERKNGPIWKKNYVYGNIYMSIGSIHALNAIRYAEERWPQPPRAELREEGDEYGDDVDAITRHVAMWKEIEDIGNGKISVEGLKTKLMFFVKFREDGTVVWPIPRPPTKDDPNYLVYHRPVPEAEYFLKDPNSFLNWNRNFVKNNPSLAIQSEPVFLTGIETEPNKNFYWYKSAELFVSAIMDSEKRNKPLDIQLNIQELFKLLAENYGKYEPVTSLNPTIYDAIHSADQFRGVDESYTPLAILDSKGRPLYFILIPFKKPGSFITHDILKIVYKNGIPWDVITSSVNVESPPLAKYLKEKLYPQIYDSKGNIIYGESQK